MDNLTTLDGIAEWARHTRARWKPARLDPPPTSDYEWELRRDRLGEQLEAIAATCERVRRVLEHVETTLTAVACHTVQPSMAGDAREMLATVQRELR